jgi:hypothetical protein
MSEISNIMGSDMTPAYLRNDIKVQTHKGNSFDILEMDALSKPVREMLGLKHVCLLPELVTRLHAPLKDWIAVNRLNKGGTKAKLARNLLIAQLAKDAPSIIGRRASKSQMGPFARLCAAVLPICGISAKGVEKAIPRILAKQESRVDP